MTLTDEDILSRRDGYACCMLAYSDKAIQASNIGDSECAKLNYRLGRYLMWAKFVADHTATSTEECGMFAHEEARAIFKKADCHCDLCGCDDDGTSADGTPNPTPDCTITPDFIVIRAVDVNERLIIEAAGPTEGDRYYVVLDTGGSGWTLNTIQEWDGSGWVSTAVPNGRIIRDSDGTYWTVLDGAEPGRLFPPVLYTLVAAVNQYTLVSSEPQIALNTTRTVIVRGLIGTTWTILYQGPESGIAEPLLLDLQGPAFTSIETIYQEGTCQWNAPTTVVPPVGECGTISVIVTPTQLCDTNTFNVDVNIVSIEGYPLGSIIAYIDNLAQPGVPATLGATTFGPYVDGQSVYFRIVNAQDSECDYVSSPVTGNWNPAYNILGSGDLTDIIFTWNDGEYIAVTDVNDLINNDPAFADLAIGDIVGVDGAYVATPEPGDILYLSNGGGAYWVVGSTPGEIQLALPGVTLIYNELIDQWTANVPYLPPASVGGGDVPIVITGVCFDTPFTIYDGPASGMTSPLVFDPPCEHGSLTGSITYQVGDCSYQTEATIELENGDLTGDPDPDFYGGLNNYVQDLRIQADRKILVGGSFTAHGITTANRFTRLNPDGTLDTDYNTAMGTGLNNAVLGVEYDPSGRALVCGFFTRHNGVPHGHIIRFNTDGSVDTSFNTGTGFAGSYVQDMAFLSDGRIVVGGLFTGYDGTPLSNFVVLNEDGSIDGSVTIDTGFNGFVQEVFVDSSDRILVAGAFTDYDGYAAPTVIRLNVDGSPDLSFNPGSGFDDWHPNDIAVLSDGRIVAVGKFTSFNGGSAPNVVMMNDDGTVDTAFMTNIGVGFGQTFQDVLVLPNDEMIISGTMFGEPGGIPGNRIIQLNTDGTRHVMFDVGLGPNEKVADVQLDLTNGSLVAGGFFTMYDGVGRLRIVRIR